MWKTEFPATVPMSSYLVALVISDFECLSETVPNMGIEGEVEVRICGREDAIAEMDYALDISTRVIKYYEDFYGVKYPLPKCGLLKLIL